MPPCDWVSVSGINGMKLKREELLQTHKADHGELLMVGVYHIHSLYQTTRLLYPSNCDVNVNLTMATTEESNARFKHLFSAFGHFDGTAITSPSASVQRIYAEAYLNESTLLPITQNVSSLVKGASFVAHNCHSSRNGVVDELRKKGFRVDGLGRCMRNGNPDGIALHHSRSTEENLHNKRQTIGRYMFNMAFENVVEPGYVTEKPFDALIAGRFCVSVYVFVHCGDVSGKYYIRTYVHTYVLDQY
jgi:hypothetical protein